MGAEMPERTRKRAAGDEAETPSRPAGGKKARFRIDEDATGDEDGPHRVSTTTSTPFSPQSRASTGAPSIAGTSMTSRSSSKRPKKYLCDFPGCNKAFDRPVRLQAHTRTHTDDRPFACEENHCDKRFFKAEHLKAHVQNKHSTDAKHVCTYVLSVKEDGGEVTCGKRFTTGSRLRRHIAVHEGKEDLKCDEVTCGMVFRKMETLLRHVRKEHLGEDAFRCGKKIIHDGLEEEEEEEQGGEECGQTFPTISQLKAHEIKEHIGKKYFCSTCSSLPSTDPLGFHTYTEYQFHLKTVHPPTCHLCHITFPSPRALAAHMEIEHSTLSSRQKFKCEYEGCDRGFTRKGNLDVHVRNVHVKKKEFVCGVFDLSGSGKVPGWVEGREGEKACGMKFGTKGNLEEHVRTQHLDLTSIYHPRKNKSGAKIKLEEEEDESAATTPASTWDLDEPPEPKPNNATLSLLTGAGYADSRPLACWTAGSEGCPTRFSREYDLALHMELKHGWNVDDINERLAEEAALGGERFWLGGVEDGEEMDEEEDREREREYGVEEFFENGLDGIDPAGSDFMGWMEGHEGLMGKGEYASDVAMVGALQEVNGNPVIDPALMSM